MTDPAASREVNFDGIVGPTHNYGGLPLGNRAATANTGRRSNPKEAALQGLAKMRFVAALGVAQAVLPPQPRPSLVMLRRLGFSGSDEQVLSKAAKWDGGHLLRSCSSASAMWTANAATVAPSADTEDGRVHITPANLEAMFHRSIEADTTHAVLRAIFADESRFAVHQPLPGGGQFGDEGAANHLRLEVPGRPAVHIFAWGRRASARGALPKRFPARQTYEASRAVARLHRLDERRCFFPQQMPAGIDAGAFHTDVLAVANDDFLMLHQAAFVGVDDLLKALRRALGPRFRCVLAKKRALPLRAAVRAYPFNSQILTFPNGKMAIVAPEESARTAACRTFLERVCSLADNQVDAVHFLDLRQSMRNGGGPACLRLRVRLTAAERQSVRANVFWSPALSIALTAWVEKHYRDRLTPRDLADPELARSSMEALDGLTRLLRIGSVYDFQRVARARPRNRGLT
ncbi:MAG: N-succinylarginine dihydrolase [Polyangiales bacterium]